MSLRLSKNKHTIKNMLVLTQGSGGWLVTGCPDKTNQLYYPQFDIKEIKPIKLRLIKLIYKSCFNNMFKTKTY